VVADIHRFARSAIDEPRGPRRWWFHRRDAEVRNERAHAGTANAMFVSRDNDEHRDDIERLYRVAIRSAKKRVVIANAYFFPGYLLLRELRRAAKRGVEVKLILQGMPDMPIVKFGAELLHDHLLRAGVKIYEYCQRPFHGKVALADDEWSTVGSSNLDPLSLALNLEANVIIRDRGFNEVLADRLERLVRDNCREVEARPDARPRLWQVVRSFIVFHVLRRFPRWAGWLPAHAPAVVRADAEVVEEVHEDTHDELHTDDRQRAHGI
jgi:cardiolipin synthase